MLKDIQRGIKNISWKLSSEDVKYDLADLDNYFKELKTKDRGAKEYDPIRANVKIIRDWLKELKRELVDQELKMLLAGKDLKKL